MAINVNVANAQAGQLSGYANQLVSAKNQLRSYKSSISTYWQGQEVSYIVRGIDQTIAQIDSVIKQLNNLSSDIKSTAATIKREDDAAAAAARARALKQQRIQAAQVNYNRAVDECDNLKWDEALTTLVNVGNFLSVDSSKKEKINYAIENFDPSIRKYWMNRNIRADKAVSLLSIAQKLWANKEFDHIIEKSKYKENVIDLSQGDSVINEKYLGEKADVLGKICLERNIKLWEK